MLKLSIVSPVYRAENIIPALVDEIKKSLNPLDISYEIILVDDASPDNSWAQILKEAANCNSIRGIKLSRNFGQHIAITAGLKVAQGDWIVVMDCDLQDDPAEIPQLLAFALDYDFEVVQAKRKNRQHSFIKRSLSFLFYRLLNYLTDANYDPEVANFGIYRKNVIEAINSMNDQVRFFPLLVKWVGFRQATINVTHRARFSGDSSYSFKKLFSLAYQNIIAFSEKPLRLSVKLGFSISFISILVGFIYLILRITGIVSVAGYASIIISIYFSLGMMLFTLGIVGTYVGNALQHSKGRPLYIVSKVVGK